MKKPIIEEFESGFPDFKTANDIILKLKQINLENIDFNDLENLIDQSLPPSFLLAEIKKGTYIYRARIDNGKSFNNISELGIRKSIDILEFGRANLPGESVFYGSNQLKSACVEVLQKSKFSINPTKVMKFVTVSVWKAKKNLCISPISFSKNVGKIRSDIANFKAFQENLKIREVSDEIHKVKNLIMEFYCDEFSKANINNHHDYKISAYYSKKLNEINAIQQRLMLDGIIYPSVAMNFAGDNFALFAEDLNSKIEFETAYRTICANFDYNVDISNFNIAKIYEMESIGVNGELNWKEKFETIR